MSLQYLRMVLQIDVISYIDSVNDPKYPVVTYYQVVVRSNQTAKESKILTRYSEIRKFRNLAKKACAEVSSIPFPSRTWFRIRKEDTASKDARKFELNAFFKGVAQVFDDSQRLWELLTAMKSVDIAQLLGTDSGTGLKPGSEPNSPINVLGIVNIT